MPVYDQEKDTIGNQYDDDAMRRTTGIDPAEEKAMEARAHDSPKSLSPNQLKNAEQSADTAKSNGVSQAESSAFGSAGGGGNFSEENGLYSGGTKKKGFRLNKVRGGGIVAGLIGAGTLGIFGILSGPLQLIHISQLLTSFHFSPMENFTDDRTERLGRYVRHAGSGNFERARMGTLGNKIADAIERKMNQSGLQSAYSEKFRYQDGFRIVPSEVVNGSNLAELEGLDESEIKQRLADQYGISPDKINIDPNISPKTVSISGLNNRELKNVQRVNLKESGYSRVGAAMRSRIMFRRGGVSLHPMKVLDRKLHTTLEARLAEYKKQRTDRIKHGVAPPDSRVQGREGQTNESGEVVQEDTTGEAEQGRQNIEPEGDTPEARKSSIRAKLGAGAGAIAAVVGTVCAIQAVAEQVDQVKFENVSLPLMRMGGEAIAVGNQIMTGQDIDFEQLNELINQLYSQDDQTSWAAAASIQAELGQTVTGPDVPEEVSFRAGENPVTQFVGSIPGIGGVCQVATSGVVTVLTTVAGFVAGPASATVGELFSRFVAGPLVDSLVNTLAGEEISIEVAGANYGNYINYGSRLAARDSAIAAGSTALTPEQVRIIDAENEEMKQTEKQYASAYDKYFNIYQYDSVASSFLMNPNVMYGNGLASMVQNPLPIFGNMSSLFNNLFSSVSAQQPVPETREGAYDYGFDEYGFFLTDQEQALVDNPYANGEEVYNLLQNNNTFDDINTFTEECFNITLDKQGDYTSLGDPVNTATIEQDCNAGPSSITSTQWTQVRVYIHDIQTLTGIACYEGDEQACQKLGFDSTNSRASSTEGIQLYTPALPTSGGRIEPKGIILHWWASGEGNKGIDNLASTLRQRGLAIQFGITADGQIYQMTTNEDDRVGHAVGGNSTTFGIEIEGGSTGDSPAGFGQQGINEYPEKFEAVVYLVQYLSDKYNIPKESIQQGEIICGDVVGVHPHKALNKCGNTKIDIDDTYFNAVMERIR